MPNSPLLWTTDNGEYEESAVVVAVVVAVANGSLAAVVAALSLTFDLLLCMPDVVVLVANDCNKEVACEQQNSSVHLQFSPHVQVGDPQTGHPRCCCCWAVSLLDMVGLAARF